MFVFVVVFIAGQPLGGWGRAVADQSFCKAVKQKLRGQFLKRAKAWCRTGLPIPSNALPCMYEITWGTGHEQNNMLQEDKYFHRNFQGGNPDLLQ
jgi:hypothetical protein